MLRMPSSSACDRISLVLMLILSAGILLGIALPAGSGWDFANFYDAGHKVLAGQLKDLYDATALIQGKPPQGEMPYYGAPLTAALFAPLALLPPSVALVAFKIQNTVVLLVALWLLYRWTLPLAKKAGLDSSRYRAIFLAAVLLFQPFWTIYRVGGQTTPTLFLGFVLALRCFTTGRMWAAALCMVTVIAIKPAFVFTLAILALFGGARFFAWTTAFGLALAAISVAFMGWGLHQAFLAHITENKVFPWIYNSSLSVFADNLSRVIGPSSLLRMAGTLTRLLAAGLVFAAMLRGRKRPEWVFLMSVVIGVVLMPVVWEHYLSVLFIPIAYWLAKLPRLDQSAVALIAAVCAFCVTQNLILVLTLDQLWQPHTVAAMMIAALFKSAPLILYTILVWRHGSGLAAPFEASSPKVEMSLSV
jgi:hypothetical protein